MRNTMTNVLSHSLRVKPALTLSEQVNKLKKKYHLEIPDEDKAKKELLNKNYFDLINGLEELFPSGVAADGKPKSFESYSFDDFLLLYDFNIQFRTYMLRIIADFEIKLKSVSSYYFTQAFASTRYGALAYLDKNNYVKRAEYLDCQLADHFEKFFFLDNTRNVSPRFQSYVQPEQPLTEILYRNRNLRKEMIENPLLVPYQIPPLWVVVKILDFGKLYHFLAYMKDNVITNIHKEMGFENYTTYEFLSVLQMVLALRNTLAHFQMVNKFSFQKPIAPNLLSKLRTPDSRLVTDLAQLPIEPSIFDITRLLNKSVEVLSLNQAFQVVEISPYLPKQEKNVLVRNLLTSMGNGEPSDWKFLTSN